MGLKLKTAPIVEPISLSEAILHLRADSSTLADSVTVQQVIAPGSHAIAAAYSLEGAPIDALGSDVLVILGAGVCGFGGSIACKIQHRDNTTDAWADVAGGAFTTITEANDNTVQELAYSGGKRYIRAVCTVAGAVCEFGVNALEYSASVADSVLISALITAAREYVQDYQNRALVTQTWELYLDDWPREDYIRIPLPPLQSVTYIKYYGTDNAEATVAATDYTVDTYSEPGRVFLRDGKNWPSTSLRPYQGVLIEFVAGYGAACDVPQAVKQAMLLLIGHWYRQRENSTDKPLSIIPNGVKALLDLNRVVPV
jgi:uncharacterized phiE125 gp8 family phage protein